MVTCNHSLFNVPLDGWIAMNSARSYASSFANFHGRVPRFHGRLMINQSEIKNDQNY